jgi:hypothetical protein
MKGKSILALLALVSLAISSAYADRDEFDSTELDAAWVWDNPAEDSSYDLKEEPGWLKITCSAGDHDIWDVRSGGPAVLLEAPDDDYTFETHYTTEIMGNCSVGLVFLNEDAVGDANSPGPWTALFTQVANRLDWQHAIGVDAIQANVADANNTYVKVEKIGDDWKFLYKQNEDDDWEVIIEGNYDIGGKHYAGMMVKNWNPGPEISAYFDYVETSWSALASPVEPGGKLTASWGQIKQE